MKQKIKEYLSGYLFHCILKERLTNCIIYIVFYKGKYTTNL